MHFWPRNSKQADIMVVLLLSRYVDNHGHLWSRDFKLTNECVYYLDSLLPAKAVNERVNLNSARETLDPVRNHANAPTSLSCTKTKGAISA